MRKGRRWKKTRVMRKEKKGVRRGMKVMVRGKRLRVGEGGEEEREGESAGEER